MNLSFLHYYVTTLAVVLISAGCATVPPLERRLLSEKNVDRLYALSDLDDVTVKQKATMARKALFSLTTPVTGYERKYQLPRRFKSDYGELMTDPAVEALTDTSYPNHWIAAQCLGKLQKHQVPKLLNNICDTDFEILHTIAWRVARVDSIAPFLVEQIDYNEQNTNILIVLALSNIEKKDSTINEALFECFSKDTSELVKVLAFHTLWNNKTAREQYNLETHVNDIIPYLDATNLWVKIYAARIMVDAGPLVKMAVPKLLVALQDTNYNVRVFAADALSAINMQTPEIETALLQSANSGRNHRAEQALRSIRDSQRYLSALPYFADLFGLERITMDSLVAYCVNKPSALDIVIARADNDTVAIRKNVIELLKQINTPKRSIERTLQRLIKDPAPEVRVAVYNTIADRPNPPPVTFENLLDALTDTNSSVVAAAEKTIVCKYKPLKDEQAALALRNLIQNKHYCNSTTMQELAPRAMPQIIEALSNSDIAIRGRAIALLGNIGAIDIFRGSTKAPTLDPSIFALYLPQLLEIASAETTWTLRHALAKYARNNPDALVAMQPYLANGKPAYRKAVTNMLGLWLFARDTIDAISPLIPALINNMKSDDKILRDASTNAIREISYKRSSVDTVLICYVIDDTPFVRLTLIDLLLRKHKLPGSVDDVAAQLDAEDIEIRKLSLSILRKCGKNALPYQDKLVQLVQDSIYGLKPQILDALIGMRCESPELHDYALTHLVNSVQPAIRSKAIELLSIKSDGQKGFMPVYINTIKDTSDDVSWTACQAIWKWHQITPQNECFTALYEKLAWNIEHKRGDASLYTTFDTINMSLEQTVLLIKLLDSLQYRPDRGTGNIYWPVSKSLKSKTLSNKTQYDLVARLFEKRVLLERDAAQIFQHNKKGLLPFIRSLLDNPSTDRETKSYLLQILSQMELPPVELLSSLIALLNSNNIWLQNEAGSLIKKLDTKSTNKLLKHWYYKNSLANPCYSDY